MQMINRNFTISYEGADLTAKTLSKLKKGAVFAYKRVDDELDSYEIIISYNGLEIDMLSYQDSLYLAPYIDLDLVCINSITLDEVKVTKGKTNAQNLTELVLSAKISYNEEFLSVYSSASGDLFLSPSNLVISMASIALNDYEEDIINQPFLNQYTFSIDIDQDSMFLFENIDFKEELSYFYCCELLLNEDFSKCKIKSYIKDENDDLTNLTLSEVEKDNFIELVNHYRIFQEEDILSPIIEE